MPFATLGLPPLIVKGVRAAGFVEPTPIQRKAIPVILRGNDLIAVAEAATGKTAAFILPILTRLLEGSRRLRALVLTPTRELAARVETNARDYARFLPLRIRVVFSGTPIQPQERMLRQEGVDLLISTPGRLLELHGRQAVSFDDVEMLVFDEADRMVDLGFAPDLRRILKLLPETRQTLLFSATVPPELNRLAKEALVEPIRVDLGPPGKPTAGITQAIYPVPRGLKSDLLNEVLSRHEVRNVIVFTRNRHGADQLARQLQRRGHSVAALHDNRNQSQRERALGDLKRGRVQILVATDVASRAIDMNGVSHVVNYDVPPTPEDYVHRIGRTARPEAVGDAFTLMSPEEQKDVAAIERFLGRTVPRVLLPDFDYQMRPTEIKQVVSYAEAGRGAPAAGPRRNATGRPTPAGTSPPARVPPVAKRRRPKPKAATGGGRRSG
ncbi:MAG TPA: DEAD/DEAH box helicase [Candidatus Eisenbacteria bacterium]